MNAPVENHKLAQLELRVPTDEVNPMQMLAQALQRGVDTVQLEKLMDLNDRWQATRARNAFTRAMAAFKAEPINILKTKLVDIPGGAKFSHATIANVVDGVCSTLSKYGFSHRWEIEQTPALITVTCILTHEDGHSERAILSGPPDDSGKKNTIQQGASTVTYLERYTLLAVTGLTARDMPDRDDQGPLELISEEQVANLKALLTEVGANLPNFLKWAKVPSLDQIPLRAYATCIKTAESKRRAPPKVLVHAGANE